MARQMEVEMPVKNVLSDEGLNWGERIEVQEFLESFQRGTHTREDTILRIVDFLTDRGSTDAKVWEDLKDVMEGIGFEWCDVEEFSVCINDVYRKRQN